jgi:hypothetical protein
LTLESGKRRAGLPGSRTGASAAGGRRPEVGAAAEHEVLARERSLETSVLGLRKSPSVHCSKPTAPLACVWCRSKHHVFSAYAVPEVALVELCGH